MLRRERAHSRLAMCAVVGLVCKLAAQVVAASSTWHYAFFFQVYANKTEKKCQRQPTTIYYFYNSLVLIANKPLCGAFGVAVNGISILVVMD